jgi:hypothetical protein
MSNSFELLQGSIDAIKKKYETLSDIVTEYGGKVHVAKETEVQRLDSSTWDMKLRENLRLIFLQPILVVTISSLLYAYSRNSNLLE